MRASKFFTGCLFMVWIAACVPSAWNTSSVLSLPTPASPTLPTPEEVIAVLLTETPSPQTMPSDEQNGPPLPTPAGNIVLWGQLIDPHRLVGMDWTSYTGQLEGTDKSTPHTFTLSYPSQWMVSGSSTQAHFVIQNVPETDGGGPVAGDFVKLEIVALKEPPYEPMDGEKQMVQVYGKAIPLWTTVNEPGQALRMSMILEKDGAFYILAGYANLATADQAMLNQYQAILLSTFSSFQME